MAAAIIMMATNPPQANQYHSRLPWGPRDVLVIQKHIHFFLLAFRAFITACSVYFNPCSMSLLTCPACVSIVAIVSSCCSTSMLIWRPIVSKTSDWRPAVTDLVEHLRELRQRLFNLFDILIPLLDLSKGSSGIAISVGVE